MTGTEYAMSENNVSPPSARTNGMKKLQLSVSVKKQRPIRLFLIRCPEGWYFGGILRILNEQKLQKPQRSTMHDIF